MWYEILVNNEFADYFINNNAFPQDAQERQEANKMLNEYSEIVCGVIIAWNFYNISPEKRDCIIKASLEGNAARAYEFCCDQIYLSKATAFHEIWHSISTNANESKYSVDISQLTAEQCAALIMYPFFSRMDGSFEKEFQESGNLKKYLLALKSKCEKN